MIKLKTVKLRLNTIMTKNKNIKIDSQIEIILLQIYFFKFSFNNKKT